MIMPPRLRRLALTAHVTTSVGWLGAVAAFLGLAAVGMISRDAQTVRGAYLVMEPAAWYVLVPLAFATLITGLIVSIGSRWGLFRHYWVLFKLLINIFATVVLLMYMKTFSLMAGVAANPSADLGVVRSASPMIHAALALLVLLVATVLAVYKPRGVTPYGWRKQYEQRTINANLPLHPDTNDDATVGPGRGSATSISWRRYVLFAIVGLILLAIVVLHLTGGGLRGH